MRAPPLSLPVAHTILLAGHASSCFVSSRSARKFRWAIAVVAMAFGMFMICAASRAQHIARLESTGDLRSPSARWIATYLRRERSRLAGQQAQRDAQYVPIASGASKSQSEPTSSEDAGVTDDLVSVTRQQVGRTDAAGGLAVPHIIWQTVKNRTQPSEASFSVANRYVVNSLSVFAAERFHA